MLYDSISRIRTTVKGWKTVFFNTLLAAPGTLFYLYSEFQSSGVDITPLIPAKYVALTMAIIGLVGLALRIATKGGVGSKAGLPSVKEPV